MKPTNILGKVHSFALTDFKAATNSKGIRQISGYANAATIDRSKEIVDPDAFASSLSKYMSNPIVFYNHDWDEAIGKVINAEIRPLGLFVDIEVGTGFEPADTVWAQIEQGILKAFSIGFRPTKIEYDEDTEILTIKDLELFEVSVVTIPMNAESLFEISESGLSNIKVRKHDDYVSYKSLITSTKSDKQVEDTEEKTIGKSTLNYDIEILEPHEVDSLRKISWTSTGKSLELEMGLVEKEQELKELMDTVEILSKELSQKNALLITKDTQLKVLNNELSRVKVKYLLQSIDIPNLIRTITP